MRYLLISSNLASQLDLTWYRRDCQADGEKAYLVTAADLAAYGIEKAIANGAREITETDAIKLLSNE